MSKSKRIKHKDFEDRNLSLIKDHKIENKDGKKKLVPPLMQIPGVNLVSWSNDKLPDMLWSILVLEALPRDEALVLFRKTIATARNFIQRDDIFIQHTDLAKLSDADFDTIMSPILSDATATKALSSLLLFDGLPDKAHWARHLDNPAGNKGENLSRAILPCLDSKSQATTDICWLKVSYLAVQQKMILPDSSDGHDIGAEMCGYPNVGDQRAVRPSMRSMELTLPVSAETKTWSDTFWSLCWQGSDPAPARDFRSKKIYDTNQLIEELIQRQKLIEDNFYETASHSPSDPRQYLIHTLTSYALYQCLAICRGDIHRRAEGIVLLRVITETSITLGYLCKKDDPDLWASYESYGRGKAKEAFVKYLEMDQAPRFVDMKALDGLVNEARWLEFQDIDLTHWDKTNLRKMSEDCGLKEIYDKYYILPSAFIHGHWAALDSLALCFNLNPLHRFKKVMFGLNLRYKSVIYDALVVLNEALLIFEEKYPGVTLSYPTERLQIIKGELDDYDKVVQDEDRGKEQADEEA